jgi:hypothetical protein
MSNVRLLISRYLDGELAEDEVARLTAMLETDAAAVNVLVFTSFIHAQLLDWMDHQSDQGCVAATIKEGHDSSLRTDGWPAKSSAEGSAIEQRAHRCQGAASSNRLHRR